MRTRLAAALLAPIAPLALAVAIGCARADDPAPVEISPEIEALATDPLADLPSPVLKRKLDNSPRSPLFYALPIIGFWLILRRRNRGVRF